MEERNSACVLAPIPLQLMADQTALGRVSRQESAANTIAQVRIKSEQKDENEAKPSASLAS